MKKRPAIYTVVMTLRLTRVLDGWIESARRNGETKADAIRRLLAAAIEGGTK